MLPRDRTERGTGEAVRVASSAYGQATAEASSDVAGPATGDGDLGTVGPGDSDGVVAASGLYPGDHGAREDRRDSTGFQKRDQRVRGRAHRSGPGRSEVSRLTRPRSSGTSSSSREVPRPLPGARPPPRPRQRAVPPRRTASSVLRITRGCPRLRTASGDPGESAESDRAGPRTAPSTHSSSGTMVRHVARVVRVSDSSSSTRRELTGHSAKTRNGRRPRTGWFSVRTGTGRDGCRGAGRGGRPVRR